MNTTSFLITVIVPVYNSAKTVKRTITSILKQPNSDFIEIIAINDGSTDNSGEILDALSSANKNICVFHKQNGGVSSTRNLGIENAHGKYIAFLDADDFWDKNFFSDDIVKKLQESDIDMFMLGYSHISSNLMYEMQAHTPDEALYSDSHKFKLPHHHFASYLYSNTLLNHNGIRFINAKINEDESFKLLCLHLANGVKTINKRFFYYYTNPSSCIHTIKASTRILEAIKATLLLNKLLEQHNIENGYYEILFTFSICIEQLCRENSFKNTLSVIESLESIIPLNDYTEYRLPTHSINVIKQWLINPKAFWSKAQLSKRKSAFRKCMSSILIKVPCIRKKLLAKQNFCPNGYIKTDLYKDEDLTL